MSDRGPGAGMVLNWRGPLLAAGIFGAVFAILLLMAHQNQSKTSDMGSSLREDPYGTSLIFDSYRRAGYEVRRSQDEDSLSDQDPTKTTAFFVGGNFSEEWQQLEGGKRRPEAKILHRLENFLARGGRVVLVEVLWRLKSESQNWQVENNWDMAQKPGPVWLSANPDAMPTGSETIYLAGEAPALKTDANWTELYARPPDESGKAGTSARVYVAMRRVGKGELIVASQESFLLNEAVKAHPNPVVLDFLAGGRPVLWVDETLHGLHQEQGVLWLIQRYRLQTALVLFWITLLLLLWTMSGDLVRRPVRDPSAETLYQGEGAGVATRRLLQRSVAPTQVVAECWEQFRRRAPQDAQAISDDPHAGPRLRAALLRLPLAGYNELRQLIAERRASAKGLAPSAHNALEKAITSPKMTSEEGRIA